MDKCREYLECRFDPVNNPPKTTEAAEQQRTYFAILIKSIEAKCQRVDPLSEEFEQSVNELYEAQRALACVGQALSVLRYKETAKVS